MAAHDFDLPLVPPERLTSKASISIIRWSETTEIEEGLDQPSIAIAQQALCIGLARTGKRADALSVFDSYLKGVRFQSPYKTLDVAGSLAATVVVTCSGSLTLGGNGGTGTFTRTLAALDLGPGGSATLAASITPVYPAVLNLAELSVADGTQLDNRAHQLA